MSCNGHNNGLCFAVVGTGNLNDTVINDHKEVNYHLKGCCHCYCNNKPVIIFHPLRGENFRKFHLYEINGAMS